MMYMIPFNLELQTLHWLYKWKEQALEFLDLIMHLI